MSYTVIICPDCKHVQIVKDTPETTSCKRCTSRLDFRALKHFFTSDGLDAAREARARIISQQQGLGEEYEDLDFDAADDIENDTIHREFLKEKGTTPEELESQTRGSDSSKRSRTEIVRDGVAACDPATEDAIREYATNNGVPGEKAEKILDRLYERGDVLRSNGAFRLI